VMAPFGTLLCIGILLPTDLLQFYRLRFIDMRFKVIRTSVGMRVDILEALEFVRSGW
jgi:propanol-preferring alcohol dehydrogenase